MAVRTTLNGAFTGPVYMGNVKGHVDLFWNASVLRLTSIAGTANDPTAVVDPELNVGLVAGMSFYFDPISDNTGTMTLAIGGESAVAITTADGVALIADAVLTGTSYLLFYDGTKLRIMSTAGVDQTGAVLVFVVITTTAADNVVKPVGFPDDGLVIIEAWGGGGGGRSAGSDGGGGGGAYNRNEYRGIDLASTETATIGAGGAVNVNGGNTSVGTLCNAFGGATAVSGGGGGGGGGQLSAGSGITGGNPSPGPAGGSADTLHGNTGTGQSQQGGGDGIWGGGAGGDSTFPVSNNGGNSLFGGGGGGGDNVGNGGASVFGGNGGDENVGGLIPAGGGGHNATGARGEVRVHWIG